MSLRDTESDANEAVIALLAAIESNKTLTCVDLNGNNLVLALCVWGITLSLRASFLWSPAIVVVFFS